MGLLERTRWHSRLRLSAKSACGHLVVDTDCHLATFKMVDVKCLSHLRIITTRKCYLIITARPNQGQTDLVLIVSYLACDTCMTFTL